MYGGSRLVFNSATEAAFHFAMLMARLKPCPSKEALPPPKWPTTGMRGRFSWDRDGNFANFQRHAAWLGSDLVRLRDKDWNCRVFLLEDEVPTTPPSE